MAEETPLDMFTSEVDAELEADKEIIRKENNLVPFADVTSGMIKKLLKDYYDEDTLEHMTIPEANIPKLMKSLRTLNKNVMKFAAPLVCKGPKCHPPGTLIRTNVGNVPIEQLTDEHVLYSWRQNSNEIIKPRKNYKHTVTTRQYHNNLCEFEIKEAERKFSCTRDHICIVRWNENARDKYGVYLMRRGNNWRIGYIRLFTKRRNQSSLASRCNTENADDAWLLCVCDNRQEAYMMEDYFSIKLSTSKMCFMAMTYNNHNGARSATKWVTQERLDQHHNTISNDYTFYANELNKLGLMIENPLWRRGGANKTGFKTCFEIRACNVISDCMDMGYDIEPRLTKRRNIRGRWSNATKTLKQYKGIVYTLDVEPYHTYIVNDIITHNCISQARCPLMQAGVAPITRTCPIELMLVDQWEKEYTDDLGIDTQSKIELDMVRDMIEADLIDWRTSGDLADSGLYDWNTIGVTDDGKPIVRKEESVALGIKLKMKNRKDKLREELLATRKVKAKFGIDKQVDPSSYSSDLSQRYNEIKEADIIESK